MVYSNLPWKSVERTIKNEITEFDVVLLTTFADGNLVNGRCSGEYVFFCFPKNSKGPAMSMFISLFGKDNVGSFVVCFFEVLTSFQALVT